MQPLIYVSSLADNNFQYDGNCYSIAGVCETTLHGIMFTLYTQRRWLSYN